MICVFVLVCSGAFASMNDAVKLHPCDVIDVSSLEGPSDYQALANNQDILSGLDDLVHSWCKQIEQVILITLPLLSDSRILSHIKI